MNYKLTSIIVSIFLLFAFIDAEAGFAVDGNGLPKEKSYKEGELLVKFVEPAPLHEKERLHKKHGAKKIKEFKQLRIDHVLLKQNANVEEAIREYEKDPKVEYAEPNYQVSTTAVPNDPNFSQLWGMNAINAPAAWEITTGSSEVVVAVVDTGIDYNHQDLLANRWVNVTELYGLAGIDDDGNGWVDDVYGYNAINNILTPMDDNGHGTHVAGTIGASGNNGVGVTGVNWNVKLLACKFLGANNSGYLSDAIECLQYIKSVKDSGVNIVASNNSWGTTNYSRALYDAISAQQDLLFIAAAGNNSSNNERYGFYPANYNLPNIISVAATDQDNVIGDFSNYSKRLVHVAAPGKDIFSTVVGNSYQTKYGTSMAAPHVTGLAALLKAQDMGRGLFSIKNLILTGGGKTAALADKTISGGSLNAYGSLICVDKPLFSVLEFGADYEMGKPTKLSALSLNCATTVGPVTVTTAGGETITLLDEGTGGDSTAGDGVFTAIWTPAREYEVLTFSSSAGQETVKAPLLRVTSPYLAEASISGVPYFDTLSARGGLKPYTWTVAAGQLPPGLTLDSSTGLISGLPLQQTYNYSFTAQVADSDSSTATEDISLTITNEKVVAEVIREYQGGEKDEAGKILIDRAGDVIVIGSANGLEYYDLVVVATKYDPAGNVKWSSKFDKAGYNYPRGAVVDTSGNIYISATELLKYGPDGNLLWSKPGIPSGPMAIDTDDNIYMASYDSIVKLDQEGNILWSKPYGDWKTFQSATAVTAIAVDPEKNIYITGDFYLLAKYDSSGNLLRINQKFPSDIVSVANGITTDSAGNVYLTGNIPSGVLDDPNRATMLQTVKYDQTGIELWSKADDFPGGRGVDVTVDGNGNTFVTGYTSRSYNDDYITSSYDSDGNTRWKRTFDCRMATSKDRAQGVVTDGNGNVFVAGSSSCDPNNSFFASNLMMIKYNENYTDRILPPGTMASPYSTQLPGNEGVAPFTWTIISGALPPGLSLDGATGIISGTPTAYGMFFFTVHITDSASASFTKLLSINVPFPMEIVSPPIMTYATRGVNYYTTIKVKDGVPPYSWAVSNGALPPGISLNTRRDSVNTFYGIPSATGSFGFTITVTDSLNMTASKEFVLPVKAVYAVRASPGKTVMWTIQQAYDYLYDDLKMIYLGAVHMTESPVFSRDLSAVIKGGYDDDFTDGSGYTTINGTLTIERGSVTVENLVLM